MFEAMHPFSPEEHAVGDREYRRWAKRLMSQGDFVGWIAEAGAGRPVAGGAGWLREQQPRPGTAPYKIPYPLPMSTEPAFRGRGLPTRSVKEAMPWSHRPGTAALPLHA